METFPLVEPITEVAVSKFGRSIRIWFPELIVIAPLPLVIEDPAINSV
jgi:hypothetical protein